MKITDFKVGQTIYNNDEKTFEKILAVIPSKGILFTKNTNDVVRVYEDNFFDLVITDNPDNIKSEDNRGEDDGGYISTGYIDVNDLQDAYKTNIEVRHKALELAIKVSDTIDVQLKIARKFSTFLKEG